MPDLAASQLDFATYLVPGYVVLLAAVLAFAPQRMRATRDRLGAGEIVASVILAFLLGLTVHRVAAAVPYASRIANGEQMLVGIVNRFQHSQAVREKISAQLGFAPSELVDSYYYGRVLIDEKAPRTAAVAERLTALALLCRNMLVAIPIAALLIGVALRHKSRRWLLWFSVGGSALLLEGFFLQGFQAYWSAAVWRVLRGVLTLT